ncbi:MAG: outer membrane lipoprotein LolB [Pseudomonadales bacterium]|nr:outer membrane lipoprotein LolB [Pseudomonadales bacterium]
MRNLAIIMMLLLTGCATKPKPFIPNTALEPIVNQTSEQTATQPTVVVPQQIWTATGKFAARTLTNDGKKKGGSVYFVWQQHGQDYQVTLTGPLGQGRTVFVGNRQQVTMQNNEGEWQADSPEILFENAFGWSAPVSFLQYWLHGQGATPQAILNYDAQGQLLSLQEQGWQAQYSQYLQALPQKIVITGANTTMTVLINDWQHNTQTP